MTKTYITEAFKKLEVLDEDTFELNDTGIKSFSDFQDKEEIDDTISIIDPKAETEDELSDSYVGKVIIDCEVCHSKIYKDPEDVIVSEDSDLVNVDEECPFCYSTDGYKVVGQVAEYIADDNNTDTDTDEIADDIAESVKPKINRHISKITEEAKVQVDYTDGKDTVTFSGANEQEAEANAKKQLATKPTFKKAETRTIDGKKVIESAGSLKESPVQTLSPQYDSRKSFYNKAHVDTGNKDDENKLYSYNTLVAEIKNGKPVVYGTYSKTTLRHIKDWLKQNDFTANTAQQIMADYGVKNESFEHVDVETEDQKLSVSSNENGKVTVETEPKTREASKEVVAPVDDSIKAKIEANSTDEDEVEDDEFVDVDFDDFDNESFDRLGESYLKSVYSNIESYKTVGVSATDTSLKLEGIIKFSSGKSKKTSFIFEAKDVTKKSKVKFIGENVQITNGKKAFTIMGDVTDKKFITESFNYNYRVKGTNGKLNRLYGTLRK